MAILRKVILFTLVLSAFFIPYFVVSKTIPQINIKIDPSPNYPLRLIVPSINVDAQIQQLGVNSQGEMDVPDKPLDVGWFKFGSLPGDIGSAVIAGHFNDQNGKPAVFANLDKLKIGDTIFIENNSNKKNIFTVFKIKIYDQGFAPDVFIKDDGVYLNLITCDGVWDKSKQSYSQRLVVFAH